MAPKFNDVNSVAGVPVTFFPLVRLVGTASGYRVNTDAYRFFTQIGEDQASCPST